MDNIEGSKIRIESAALKQHLELRSAAHREKANTVFEHAKQVKKLGLNSSPDLQKAVNSYTTNRGSQDPAQDLLDIARGYDKKSSRFQVLAKYLVPNAVYTLSENEADSLELLGQFRRNISFE